ncbi:MAG: ATP-binding protein [Acidobacteriota bacterium]
MTDHSEACRDCGGTGFRVREVDGYTRAARCACRSATRSERLLAAARVPERYRHCELANYEIHDEGQRRALAKARYFVESFPAIETGILFSGKCGVGKTHLAVGILRALSASKGVPGLFVDFRDLLKEIRDTYNPSNPASANQVLAPVFGIDLLILDDLGAAKPTDWVRDTLAHVINRRYNEEKITVFTTNFPDRSTGSATDRGDLTLSDRIGATLRSRLDEMCRVIDVQGPDYRHTFRQAAYRW